MAGGQPLYPAKGAQFVAQALDAMLGRRGAEPFVLALAQALLAHGFGAGEDATQENVMRF